MLDKTEHSPNPKNSAVTDRLISNVPVEIDVFLERTQVTIADLNALATGSVLPLDSPLNSLFEIRLSNETIAVGELVSVDDKFGIRIVEIR
ncbi:FliM/FliN family flagellar motor switch protein [Maricaulis sp. D1M11]|uniref:FliM/FliN family flagellar motor switch protein n=1 Tax=Maricaulis sp. D1M11 TaxID=3076117 RepID=UPI0039B438F5